jgi:MOSC domain-containing protein YiiM
MSMHPVGRVLAIAIKSAEGGPMVESQSATAVVDAGLAGNAKVATHRGVTFLSARQWRQITAELEADIPWHLRRANILIDADSMASLIGRTVALGEAQLVIKGETHPCGLMDQQHQGLRAALKPDCRGGVYGQVVRGGTFRVGDLLSVVETTDG